MKQVYALRCCGFCVMILIRKSKQHTGKFIYLYNFCSLCFSSNFYFVNSLFSLYDLIMHCSGNKWISNIRFGKCFIYVHHQKLSTS
ncbi:hypothetical protein Ahy_B04g072227 isoform C [Arachis hypogaea]|uniref:Uncharacterized protein n=1 Tax=Arachis hypogaea TaxID=3818 RepID=A0A444ZMQ1_ARAHY|nr:hypothetical protein Ahy_B04g072227 isoform C [Arachis hypogaea]